MSNSTEPAASAAASSRNERRQKRQGVYLPKWLLQPDQAQAIAHGRCLMVLAVLSGQKTVKEAIGEQKICRTLYYQLESRALKGMVRALSPARSESGNERRELRRAQATVRRLRGQLTLVMQRKRSLERLLSMVLKTNRVSINTARRGRRPKALSQWMMRGADSP
jgi:hypothetical protein